LLSLACDLLPKLLQHVVVLLQVQLAADDFFEEGVELIPQLAPLLFILAVDELLDLAAQAVQ